MNGEILFLSHRLPFPPDRGDKIRSHHILKALAQLAPVHVGCFVETDDDRRCMGELDEIAESHFVSWRQKRLRYSGMEALLRHEPVSLAAFRNGDLAYWVRKLLASDRISAAYVFSGQMGQYIPDDWDGHFVMDLVDVDSAKFEAFAHYASFPRNWINAREARLLSRFEDRLARRADHTLLVSESEAELMRARAPQGRDIRALYNGIDADRFAPGCVLPAPEMVQGGPHFVFTGQMDYLPNVVAVERMATAILPAIRNSYPDATFHIVGRAPTADVQALEKVPGCVVHGEVPDMRPFLVGADIVVAPLTIARGVQNKVLEGMAMEKPVLVSQEAATGIEAKDCTHFVIAHNDRQFADEACALLADPQRAKALGRAARKLVVENQSWPAVLAQLPALMGLAGRAGQ